MVISGDDFETIANGFVSALVTETVVNGLGLWLSAVTTSKLSRMGSYQRWLPESLRIGS